MLRLVLFIAALFAALPVRAEPLVLGRFSAGDLHGWQVRDFEGETRYRIAKADGTRVLEADSAAGASSLYLEREIDLAARPVLEWRWRVEAPLSVPDERVKAGDDFAARVYVVAPGEGLFALPIAISYVWAGSAPVGADWPNPFTSRVRMVAVESGTAHAGQWRSYRRNLREDFRRLFGREVDELEGVAVMTDADNSRQRARAWYGDILLRAEDG
ncbi:MAG: DUF3047 domain-containing protein [Alphaproteobacteria bacterium]|nr:DUF3047 domain-containing protein [Alphaproteobacteria bacterium]MYE58308.1 DUF3047 domain-containing protein [Alphaproteobacteria bacterium]